MKKTKIKPSGSLGLSSPVGFNDKILDKMCNTFERQLKAHAKSKNYKIDGLIWVYPLHKKR